MSERSTHDGQQQQESPLKTERGSTTVQDGVVSKVAGIAAQEVGASGWADQPPRPWGVS